TLLPIVGADEELVRSYLKRFLLEADTPKEFEPYINDVYLRHLFAEAKIENGLGDAEQWASHLPPELFRQLKERIDIDFAATNRTDFAADELVRLDLFVKNVPNLLVKVFEVNTLNFYRTHQRDADTDLNLYGPLANAQQAHAYAEPPRRRLPRRLALPPVHPPAASALALLPAPTAPRAR